MQTIPVNDDISKRIRRISLAGFGVIFVAFGVAGGWAATAPLGSAAIGNGIVVAETNKKTVQHFEGGIIASMNVREGDHVNAGQILFVLDSTQPQANFDIYRNQYLNALAQEARLAAEQDGRTEISFPTDWGNFADDLQIKAVVADQNRQFRERKASLVGQIALLQSQIVTLKTEVNGLRTEQEGKERQVEFLVDEIRGLRDLYDKGIAPKSRLLALEREKASLAGQIGRSIADQAKAENGMNEADLKIGQLKQQFFEQTIKELVEVRGKIADLRERVTVARDVLRRLEIIAPTSGTVQGLQVFTLGAVIRPGQPLLDIAPDNDQFVVQAQFLPADADGLKPGMQAEVRFSSLHERTIPMIPGTLRSLSRDRLVDETSKQPYYLAVVIVEQKDLPSELKGRIMPGLPSEVIVPLTERTVVEYLAQPLMNTLRRTMRER